KWFKRFKEGNESLDDEPRSGCQMGSFTLSSLQFRPTVMNKSIGTLFKTYITFLKLDQTT
ncbi:hypothetical protein WH47_09876, partial [Habropoda laboriosa]